MSEIVENVRVTVGDHAVVTCRSDAAAELEVFVPPAPEHTIAESLTSFAARGVGSSAQVRGRLRASSNPTYESHVTLAQRRKAREATGKVCHPPELKEDFEKSKAEQRKKEQADEEKQAKRKADDEAGLTQIEHNIRSKMFNAPMFRCKDKYMTFAGALDISRDGRLQGENQRIPRRSHARPPTIPNIHDLPHPSTPGESRPKNPAPDRNSCGFQFSLSTTASATTSPFPFVISPQMDQFFSQHRYAPSCNSNTH
ncbi:hypothetical protein PAXINDRAFT_14833 [Paxillus involutus ATCC 200175]|uniref:Uncharacterized protein n=1 Tax=Paxillus involutus ATCC 200175 TaxID=664439 RepID=A0A0C9TP81_PAXIN|nr:hypothetical protein PAXINDRAFT_14833 [Paxillus involutus ATCC 200175]